MHLKAQDWTRFRCKQWLQKCPNGQVMAIFARSPKPAFSDNVQKREQRKFFKSRRKSCLRLKDPKAIWREWHYPRGSESTGMAKLWQFSQGNPKPAISEKVQRRDQGKFLKNRPKCTSRLIGPRALWRKWHYPLVNMRIYSKDWRRFWRKRRVQNCPNTHVMAIFERSPKTLIFRKSVKGGPREIFQKSPKK